MSTRAVFFIKEERPYYFRRLIEFEYVPGLSPAQKKKNVENLRQAVESKFPEAKLLEISTKSFDPTGEALSPFRLTLRLPSLKKDFPIENIFQASKVFEQGGPYVDLLGTTPLEAKRDERLNNSGEVVHFAMEAKKYPAHPSTAFYTWLYFLAIRTRPLFAKRLLAFNAFSDIENAKDPKGGNQAMACCMYVSMAKAGILSRIKTFDDLVEAMYHTNILEIKEQKNSADQAQSLIDLGKASPKRRFSVGDWIIHPKVGKGEVIKKDSKSYTVYFKVSGPKVLSKAFVERECQLLD